MLRKFHYAAFAAAMALATGAQAADMQDCSLKQIASLPITTLSDGRIAVSAKVNNVEGLFVVNLSQGPSGLNHEFVEKQGWDTQPVPSNVAFTYGAGKFEDKETITRQIKVGDFLIGVLDAKDTNFLVIPLPENASNIIGELGSVLLRNFDVEFDFANEKINMFSHDHCAGDVVYWAKEYAALPLSYNDFTGEVTAPMALDGNRLTVSISTSARPATMLAAVASYRTRIPLTDMTEHDGEQPFFTYPFKTLSLNGLSIQNPTIEIIDPGAFGAGADCSEAKTNSLGATGISTKAVLDACATDLTIGLHEIRKLHLYFAFGENKLYVTAADAHK